MRYSIRDLEHLSGIRAHTLRVWEQRYDILQPKRTDTNIRYYDDGDLKLVLNIALLNENGFKISRIAEMTPEQMKVEVAKITDQNFKYPEQIQALTLSMIDLDEDRFEKIISTNILHFGFERTMQHIVFPFLTRIGFLWQTGAINPAQEHFITFLIRQKIIVAMDGIVTRPTPYSKKFMLYLPEGELHETTLLFAAYIIKKEGHKVIYLGQSLPFEDVVYVYQAHKPDYILCVITTTPGQSEIQGYVDKMAQEFKDTQVKLSGFQVVGQDLNLADNQEILLSVAQLEELLAELARVKQN